MRLPRLHPLLWLIVITAPFVLWAKLQILPTFDDWTTLSLPNYDTQWQQYFLPYGSSWRPFDAAIGFVYSIIGNHWFPTLSHLLIFAAHIGSTVMVYKLAATLGFDRLSRAVATVFFYMSPCVLATVMACDSLNQSYSMFWGLMAVWLYLTRTGRWRHPLWMACVLMAVLSKENGLAWAVVPPVVAFGFQRIDRRTLLRHLALGVALAVAYAVVRLSLPTTDIYYDEYHDLGSISRKLKAVAVLITYTWLPGDYIYLMHAPSRNIVLFLLTLLPTLPFLWMLFFHRRAIWTDRRFWALAVAAVITVSPNLLINMSMMNAYAWLGMSALIVALGVQLCQRRLLLMLCFVVYLLATSYTYVHHWYCTWQTSLPAQYMAEEAIAKTGRRVDRVYVITIEEEERKFSSFCTLPTEAFGWGRAVWGQTDFKWPVEIGDTIVGSDSSRQTVDSIAAAALQRGYECVWIVNKDHVDAVQ